MGALTEYLKKARQIHDSGLATIETSYYAALDSLFQAAGAKLTPPVAPIQTIKDQGAGHPDYALQEIASQDIRAAVEVKGPGVQLDQLATTDQVRKYLRQYDPTLITNLREFGLVRWGEDGQPEIFQRYMLAASAEAFWQTPIATLVQEHERGLEDFLATALSWTATITRPRDLAAALARYARVARTRLAGQRAETLSPLRAALGDALGLRFTDEQGEHFFHSSLVQTLFYGLFSAWVVWNQKAGPGSNPQDFRWREASDYLRLPVLAELFEHIARPGQLQALDVREPLEWAEATLRRTNWGVFSAAFDASDAVNYFYEPFLEAYDPDLREQLGVWYTPREIIRYQVARVDRLLREELGTPLGLADPRVLILDPATGTGGYLLEVLRVIDQTLREQGAGALRALRLREAATRRVFGFEILPAPFIIAHLQFTTLLAALGAPLAAGERAGVYLTNALTGWKETVDPTSAQRDIVEQKTLESFPKLKAEIDAARRVKRGAPILVVLGNPPYRGAAGVAEEEEAELLAPYYQGLDRFSVRARAINDLYIRFFRLAERQIAETTGRGIVCFISNYGWLSGLSHPAMRERLLGAFDKLWIDNLNGDKYATGKRTPWGTSDQSVFTTENDPRGIQVGTAVTTLVRKAQRGVEPAQVWYRDFWGLSSEKRAALVESLKVSDSHPYTRLQPDARARYTLRPGGGEEAYHTWPALPQIFPTYYPGFKTSRDADLVSIDREPLEARMRAYFDKSRTDAQVAEVAPVLMKDASRYDAEPTRRELLRTSGYHDDRIMRVAYRPLDDRWLYREPTTKLLDRKRAEFFEQVFPNNLYLQMVRRQRRSGEFDNGAVLPGFMDINYVDGGACCFPLLIRHQQGMFQETAPNLRAEFIEQLPAEMTSAPDFPTSLFYHLAAILNTPEYRHENAGTLEGDWPRVPIPATREALEASARLGMRVAALLRPDMPFSPGPELVGLGEPSRVDDRQLSGDDLRVTVRYSGVGRYEAPSAGAGADGGRLWWNDDCFWAHVPKEVWSFTIGGYPVIKKWLDYRHIEKLKRPLLWEEVDYVREMVQRLAALLGLGPALDANYAAVKASAAALDLSRLGRPSLALAVDMDEGEAAE